MPESSDDEAASRRGWQAGPDAGDAAPVLVRPDGVLLSGVDDEAAWGGAGRDELRWSFGVDLAQALAGTLAAAGEGGQEELLADLEAWDRAAADSEAGGGSPVTADAVGAGGGDEGEAAAGGPACGAAPGTLGLIADALPAGPGLGAWLAQCAHGQLSDADLPAVAAAARRVTSWAQATELAVVAQMTVRSAARHPDTGLTDDGRPAAVTRDAAAQAGLALTLSPGAAAWWTDLAVTLGWRLPALHAALLTGQIDMTKVRIIAEATAVLSEEAARAVVDQILSGAVGQTYGQLRAAVTRAVILADPQGAEERRQATERRARVGLYPGDHHTATLTGMNLPAVHAAAAMARLTALARAMQAAGAGGGLDLLRAHAYLGLLLSTLPPIPPRPDAPPDTPPPDPNDPGDLGPDDLGPDDPDLGSGGPGSSGGRGAAGPGGGGSPADDGPGAGHPDGEQPPAAGLRGRDRPRGADDPGTPPRSSQSRGGARREPGDRAEPDTSRGDARPGRPLPDRHPGGPSPGPPDAGHPGPGDPSAGPDRPAVAEARSDRLPPEGWPGDADAPADDGSRPPPADVPEGYADEGGYPDYDLFDEPDDPDPIPAWPGLPATTTAAGWPSPPPDPDSTDDAGRPTRGRLDLLLPWSTLALRSASPGTLTRIGPITAEQARLLAAVAAASPATRWRVILTDTHGHALAVTAIPRHATRPRRGSHTRRPGQPAPRLAEPAAGPSVTGLTGRVTITVPITALDAPVPVDGHPLLPAIATTAARLLLRLQREAQACPPDPAEPGTSPGGCAHNTATPAYRPTTPIREYVTVRDQTCRYPCCRQPAWHADLDHTHPWHKGGRTCPCNLGALCRAHHILKQLQGWTLTQPRPGVFQWTTPTGRVYTTEPDIHPA